MSGPGGARRPAADGGFGSMAHLAGRFVGSLRPGGPHPGDEAWARAQLRPGEALLWARMSGPDRRHAVGVARRTIALLGGDPDAPAGRSPVARPVVAAALLHDVGKVESVLGTWGRAVVTAVALAAGRDRVAAWEARRRGWRADAGRYVNHDRLGAELLAAAGSEELTVTWTRQHHLPAAEWTLPAEVTAALKAADGD